MQNADDDYGAGRRVWGWTGQRHDKRSSAMRIYYADVSVIAAPGDSLPQRESSRHVQQRMPGGCRCRLVSTCRRSRLLAVAVALIGIGWSRGFGGAAVRHVDVGSSLILFGPLSLAVIGLFLVAERVRPAQRRPLVARGHRHDLLFTCSTRAASFHS